MANLGNPEKLSGLKARFSAGGPLVASMERCMTHQIETRFQRLFCRQPQSLGRMPQAKMRQRPWRSAPYFC